MTPAEYLRSIIAYNRWANERVLSVAEPLLGLAPSYTGGYGVLADTLLHVLQAQECWVARWRGAPIEETEEPTTAALLAAYERSHDELEAFAAELADSDLERPLRYRYRSGPDHVRPLGQLIAHLVNHNTFHRGEAALLLTQQGHSPGDLDYVDYLGDF